MTDTSIDELKKLTKPIKPYQWEKYSLTVIGDGYTKEGKRIHLVSQDLGGELVELANAYVIGGC